MKKLYCLAVLLLHVFLFSNAQVSFTATAGVTSNTYTNLGSAFGAINNGTHQGVITISITGSTTEGATAILNASGGTSSYTSVLITPTVPCTITGNIEGPLLEFNGAANATIDGRINPTDTTRSLTIQNADSAFSAGSTIYFTGKAGPDTVRYVNLKGCAQGAPVVYVGGGTLSAAGTIVLDMYSYAVIDHNEIGPVGTSVPSFAIYAAADSSATQITNNLVHDFDFTVKGLDQDYPSGGIFVTDSATISGNSVYLTQPVVGSHNYQRPFISAGGGVIDSNFVGGSQPYAGGGPATLEGNINVAGIQFAPSGYNQGASLNGNVVTNFNITENASPYGGGFVGISVGVRGGAIANVGTLSGNTVGSLTNPGAIAVTYNGAPTEAVVLGIGCGGDVNGESLYLQNNTVASLLASGAQATGISVTGISVSTISYASILNNSIGGTTAGALALNTGGGSITGIYVNPTNNSYTQICTGNTIQNLFNNCAGGGNATIQGINLTCSFTTPGIVTTPVASALISQNTLSNLIAADTIATNGSVTGIYLGGGHMLSTVSQNSIHDIASFSTGALGVVAGISNQCAGYATLAINSNTIYNLLSRGANANPYSSAAVQGIGNAVDNNGTVTIAGNTVYNLVDVAPHPTYVTGINCVADSISALPCFITANRVYALTNMQSLTGVTAGILLRGAQDSGIFTVANNMISLAPDTVATYGILNNVTAYQINLYYNSIAISGTAAGNNTSAAFYKQGADSTYVTSVNNIFYNGRTGGGNQYAIVDNNPGSADAYWSRSNYNNFYTSDSGTVVLWGTDTLSFAGYKTLTNLDSMSLSQPVNFTNLAAGNLDLINDSLNQRLAGTPIPGILVDFHGNPRHATPTMGADEILVSTLPVTFASFTAALDGKFVQLTWQTASEINEAYYIVERSPDGFNFTELGQVSAKGGQANSYAFNDDAPLPGTNYYRIKAVDKNGYYAYSAIRLIKIDILLLLKAQPSIISGGSLNLLVQSTVASNGTLLLTSLSGKILLESQFGVGTGSTNQQVDIASLAAGQYFVTLTTPYGQQTVKIIKAR